RTTQVVRYAPGRDAFANYIRESLRTNKPYNQMASELIAATGTDSYTQGELNWPVGGIVNGGPNQDIYDQLAVNTATTFLGLSTLNCLECHNGRGHLTNLNYWGQNASRMQAWQISAFFSRTQMARTPVSSTAAQPYYWRVVDNNALANYALNTTTGNRPARQ